MTEPISLGPADLEPGQKRRVDVAGSVPVAVFNIDGDYYVIDDTCTHAFASLSEGEINEDCITCPVHAGTFHIPTGKATGFPAEDPIRTHDVTVTDGIVYATITPVAAKPTAPGAR